MTYRIARPILTVGFPAADSHRSIRSHPTPGFLKGIVELSPVALVAIIVAAAIVLFAWNRLPVAVVAMFVCLALWASGVLSLDQALAGFGDPVVILIATLFVVSSALEVTGVTAWIGKQLIRVAGKESRIRFIVLMMSLSAVLAMLVGGLGAVAALLPVVIVTAVRLGRKSSQLLMPLAFAAHAGSMLALTGTPVNVLVSDAAVDAGAAGFGFFEFGLVGLPLLVGSVAIVILVGERVLPQRNGATIPADFSRHARTLVEQYGLGGDIHRLRVRGTSLYVGREPSAIDITRHDGMQLVAVQQGDTVHPVSRPHVAEGDHILLRGDADVVAKFATEAHLSFREYTTGADDILFTHQSGLAEVAIPPRSGLIGQSVFPGMVTESGDLIVLAVQKAGAERDEREAGGQTGVAVLEAGDTMLLQGTWKALDLRLSDPDVLAIDSPDLVRRQAVPMGTEAKRAAAISAAMILLLATGLVPPAVAGLLAAGAIILSGILTAEQSYHAITWTTVILVAAMKPLGTAMTETGAAQMAANQLLSIVGQGSPTTLLAGLFLLTAVLAQFISYMATALIMIPIGVAAAAGMGISPRPVLMSTAVATAAAFLTPIAAPANAMIMGPGGYRFGDYWKLGLPLLAWFFMVSVFVVPLIWGF